MKKDYNSNATHVITKKGFVNTITSKSGHSILTSMFLVATMVILLLLGIHAAKGTSAEIASSEAFSLTGLQMASQLIYEDAGYSKSEVKHMTDSQIRSLYGDDLDDARVDIMRKIMNEELDLNELAQQMKETGWTWSAAEVAAMQEMTGDMFTEEQIRAYFDIQPDNGETTDITPNYLDHLKDENIQAIVKQEAEQERSAAETDMQFESDNVLCKFLEDLFQ